MGYLTGNLMASPATSSPSDRSFSGRLVLVFSTSSDPEGTVVKGLLEAEGIPVVVKGEIGGPYRTGSMDLWIPEELEPQARMILEDARAGRPATENSE
jgi:hypothetical protein